MPNLTSILTLSDHGMRLLQAETGLGLVKVTLKHCLPREIL